MTFDEYNKIYWRMYLALEKELVETLYYVELNTNNYSTTSMKFSKLLLSIGAEIDNVFRECTGLTGRSDIEFYYNNITTKYSSIISQQVKIKDESIVIMPYDGWNGTKPSKSLVFWDKYNELKHDRVLHSQNASLETVLNALAGLFIIEMYRFNDIYMTMCDTFTNMPDEDSKLFVLNSWDLKMRDSKLNLDYSLYDEERGTYLFQK